MYRIEPDQADEKKQVKRHVKDEPTFTSLNFRWDRIVTVPNTEVYDDGEELVTIKTTPNTDTTAQTQVQPTESYTFTISLQKGDSGEAVRQLQIILQAHGYFPSDITPNGNFGPTTEQAVMAFQQAKGLSALGVVGPQTRVALHAL
ncbi:MAG: hypothetical protein COV60_00500 [Candidatus Magasanikbacteria bacterium CG11_big_fil_rev_8_21_14_0_20_43_7]|uniref:Peptidoglycan binding-like domain-containing protein n=1 Tax=Candidatus Magasanikbacteria bacterium CG11_big_fil_rev_8_21_14_0_20_43_7 TaxID=1974654 RepID=A0A2H0N3F1_9BACT|nr:MAG: hypothetical protein COV60_00500 [Candidatus Magasanikbacteria bacterium CG11_big_fil_rev_8_21_14_0_20_43_7]